MGKRLEPVQRSPNGQYKNEKVPNIISHERDANKNQNTNKPYANKNHNETRQLKLKKKQNFN